MNTNSTTEEDTEEEIPASSANKKTKRRRRNFSSSTSSSYSSSLATNSTVHSNNVTPANTKRASGEGQSSSKNNKDLIAYRTRSRTQSVERSVDLETSSKNLSLGQKRKSLRASRSQLISDSDNEEDSQEEQLDNVESVDKSDKNYSNQTINTKSTRSLRGAGVSSSKKISEKLNNPSNKKTTNSSASTSVNSETNQPLRSLRSRASFDQQSTAPTNSRRKPSSTSVIPKKRLRIGEQGHQSSVSGGVSTNPESTGSGSKAPNLGARLARNQGGREPHNTAQQQQDTSSLATASTSTQQPGHPPQNLLRRSSRGKGASSSSTTGSCVSIVLKIYFCCQLN